MKEGRRETKSQKETWCKRDSEVFPGFGYFGQRDLSYSRQLDRIIDLLSPKTVSKGDKGRPTVLEHHLGS